MPKKRHIFTILVLFLSMTLVSASVFADDDLPEINATNDICEPDQHEWGTEYTIDIEVTCTSDGAKSIHCLKCGYPDEESTIVIPALGHKYDQESKFIFYLKSWATCTEPSVYYKSCSNCGERGEETFTDGTSLGHDYAAVPDSSAKATCTKDGKESDYKCTRCGYLKVGSIVKANHTEIEIKGKKPTCTEAGKSTGKKCSICGAIIAKQEELPALGHKWSASYTVDIPATYATAGSKSIHCSRCGIIQEGSETAVPKLAVKPITISKLTAAKKALTVKWKKASGVNGYEIQYGLKKDFKGAKKVKISKASTTSGKITKLKSKKTYYVRIRTYKTVSGKKYYSKWSSAKKAKVK